MKIQTIKFTVMVSAALIFLTTCASSAWAQTLRTGELVYGRTFTDTNGACTTAAIWAVGLDGSNDRFITYGRQPRISPDGRKLLFKRWDPSVTCNSGYEGYVGWFIRDLTTGMETQISGQQSYNFGNAFSPETNRADRQITQNEGGGLCQMNIDGMNRVCNGSDINPIRGVLGLSVRGGDSQIVLQNREDDPANPVSGFYKLSYDLTNIQKIPGTNYYDWSPSWSNDGQTIAYGKTVFRGASYVYLLDNLYTIKPDGTNQTQITFFNNLPYTDGFSLNLVWTPDNQTILDTARLNGVAGIYKIAADGSGIQGMIPLTPGPLPEWVGGIVPVRGDQQIASWGGGVTTGGSYTLVDTVGQAFAGQTSVGQSSSGACYNLQSGFWAEKANKTLFDYDGDGKADFSVFRPSSGAWFSLNSSNCFSAVQFGIATDKITPADFDGDGVTDVAVFRPAIGNWFILGSTAGFQSIQFGISEDIPAPADFDGDGKADIAVFRPSIGTWYILGSTSGFQSIQFGQAGDVPVAADYDGDGRAEAAVFRPSNGAWYEYRTTSGFYAVQFGLSTDLPAKADFDGDGKTDVAVFRPSSGTWYLLESTLESTAGINTIQFGQLGDRPAPADFDGDGKADVAVYRGNTWLVQRSTLGFQSAQFGAVGDIPAPSAFIP